MTATAAADPSYLFSAELQAHSAVTFGLLLLLLILIEIEPSVDPFCRDLLQTKKAGPGIQT